MSKKIRKTLLPIAASVAGGLLLGPAGLGLTSSALGAAAGAGVGNYTQTHNIGSALASAGGSYLGGQLGSSIGGGAPTVIGGLESALGPDLGSYVGQGLGGELAMTPINALVGSTIGSNLASSLVPQKTASNVSDSGVSATQAFADEKFKPQREAEDTLPASFQSFGSLTPQQLSSNIATGGVYGGGQGPGEQNYFLNMINRRLVTDEGQVDSDLSEVNPIENSYLAQLGLGGYGNATDLLEAISKRKQA